MRALSLLTLLFLLPVSAFGQSVVSGEEAYAGGPAAPEVKFADGLGQQTWRQPGDITLTWNLPDSVEAVATDISTSSSREPQTPHRPPVTSFTVKQTDLVEGVQYLAVQFKNTEKWGQFTAVPIWIDATGPENIAMNIDQSEEQGAPVLFFQATDQLSGMSHYKLSINGRPMVTIDLEDANFGYQLDPEAIAPYEVSLEAYDQAGNVSAASVVVVPTTLPSDGFVNGVGFLTDEAASVLVAVLAAVMLLLFGYLILERQRTARYILELERETNEIHTQLLRIFTALREEIHDQIRSITKKKRLSKKEKEAVDGLNNALTVSESLIEREIKDVKDLLEEN